MAIATHTTETESGGRLLEATPCDLRVTYDRAQHAIAERLSRHKRVASAGCPATGGKDEEISPLQLVASGLSCCMLFAMGSVAERDGVDLSGTTVESRIALTEASPRRIGAIELTFQLPGGIAPAERKKLEAAASTCPIHHSFHPDTPIYARFRYTV